MIENFDFVNSLPGLVVAKDNQSVYLNISDDFAQLLGWKSADECHGKTDYEIPCDAVRFAKEFIAMDQKVIASGKRMLALDIQHYALGWKLILVERKIITDKNGKTIGLLNHCLDVSDVSFFKAHFLLYSIDKKLQGDDLLPVSYILNNEHKPLPLTDKQENCLFLLVRGKTIKEIAKILNLSPRTVEDHLDGIKTKLGCHYKSEIIEKAIDSNFLYYIPDQMQKYELDKIL